MSSPIRLGRYECPGRVPIIVEDKGTPAESDTYGPWIRYRFEWEPVGSAVPVLFTDFLTLLAFGYVHTESKS